MKLNKRRVKMLPGIIVGVLLLVGTCIGSIINSVDYTQVEEDIATIDEARIESKKLMAETGNFTKNIILGVDLNTDELYEEIDKVVEYRDKLIEIDLEKIKEYYEVKGLDYTEIINKYNNCLRTNAYCCYIVNEIEDDSFQAYKDVIMASNLLSDDEILESEISLLEEFDYKANFVEYK